MKHILYAVLITLAFVTDSFAAADDVLIVEANKVNVRESPSMQADVLTTLSRGSRVVEVSRDGNWIRVRGALPDETEAYIHRSLLVLEPSGGALTEPKATDQQILDMTRRVSKKLEEALREIGQLNKQMVELNRRLNSLENKVDRYRREIPRR